MNIDYLIDILYQSYSFNGFQRKSMRVWNDEYRFKEFVNGYIIDKDYEIFGDNAIFNRNLLHDKLEIAPKFRMVTIIFSDDLILNPIIKSKSYIKIDKNIVNIHKSIKKSMITIEDILFVLKCADRDVNYYSIHITYKKSGLIISI